MINEIKNLKDLVGKTIVETKHYLGDLWIKFSDNTFAVLEINDISEGYSNRSEVNLNQYSKDKTEYVLVELGLITKAEYDLACEQEELEYKKQTEARAREENERIEKIELEQLEKLARKYNNR